MTGPETGRPATDPAPGRRRPSTRVVVGAGLLLSLVLAGALSLVASSHPDGLERVAETLGFGSTARDSAAAGSPLADYTAAGVDGPLSGGLAGIVGVVVVAAVMFGLVALLRWRR